MGFDIDVVLVPVDATASSQRAIEHAFALADRYEGSVHVLHVIDEPIAQGIQTGDVDPEAVAEDHIEVMADTDDRSPAVAVGHSTAYGFSPNRLRQHPGSVILDVAEELSADFIVVPREQSTGAPEETLGKSALYVLQYASQPVLSV